MRQLDIDFTAPPPMTRTPDHDTSESAADRVRGGAFALRARLLVLIRERGPITAIELEELPEFARYGPSSIRKRISENYAMGQIMKHDARTVTTRAGRATRATAWIVAPPLSPEEVTKDTAS